MPRHFGHIPGIVPGATFVDRRELREAGVHLPTQAGVSGSATEGADSIVLSGGYEDDDDQGSVIVYTGEGGRDPLSGRQVKHQQLVRGNLALAVSHRDGLPVRVTRGSRHTSAYSPETGYQYAGLYRVDDHWREEGKSGFFIWRFRLLSLESAFQPEVISAPSAAAVRREMVTVQRLVRDTAEARRIKALYGFRCQVCGEALQTSAGPYAEAAHIRPLGAPHHGPDHAGNLLCLCPNHHVLFDFGTWSIADDFGLIGLPGKLMVHPEHQIDPAQLAYHRARYFQP
ncbi:YDG/SRA domain-containing protein [Deinococcus sp. SL84]|uniref:YDG/SRA domain-containing protein n=1 Tax=Deinococcus sp. SL84 TaxID=2994663 RepID=UPI0022766956|nr:YDG/SRA domain-containing protein [Deinococcus sp. SL84]MCY1701914.1 HNH endonuclease [Deinococcus sp. SL84]